MKLRIAQSGLRDALHRWRRNNATKGTAYAITGIVRHDEQNIRRAFGWDDGWRPPGLGVLSVLLDHPSEFRGRWRKLLAINCRRRAG